MLPACPQPMLRVTCSGCIKPTRSAPAPAAGSATPGAVTFEVAFGPDGTCRLPGGWFQALGAPGEEGEVKLQVETKDPAAGVGKIEHTSFMRMMKLNLGVKVGGLQEAAAALQPQAGAGPSSTRQAAAAPGTVARGLPAIMAGHGADPH